MQNDPRDCVLHAACPMVMAPTLGTFMPLEGPGKRLIAARDGIYLEARSEVLHWLLKVSSLPMPYGVVSPFLTLLHGPMPLKHLYAMADQALDVSPAEIAFAVQHRGAGYELLLPASTSASRSHVTYNDTFHPGRLVLDLHSHGEGNAYFSGTDDTSDASRTEIYIAAVIAPRTTYSKTRLAWRAVCAPYLIPLDDDTNLVKELFA